MMGSENKSYIILKEIWKVNFSQSRKPMTINTMGAQLAVWAQGIVVSGRAEETWERLSAASSQGGGDRDIQQMERSSARLCTQRRAPGSQSSWPPSDFPYRVLLTATLLIFIVHLFWLSKAGEVWALPT